MRLIDADAMKDKARELIPNYHASVVMNLFDLIDNLADNMPTIEPTLYGYKIEHLAYIARVMEKEGVTAEYAVRTFDDMGRAIKMIVEETQEIVDATLFCERRETDGAD